MTYVKIAAIAAALVIVGLVVYSWHQGRKSNHEPRKTSVKEYQEDAVATFAGGCFWCVESDFEKVTGVKQVVSGYSGGDEQNPAYKEVASGATGHREAVQVYFDPPKQVLLRIPLKTVQEIMCFPYIN
jgi:peptide methionine sulfoxide reductase msrA/msrB